MSARRRTLSAVLGVTALALLARLVGLGTRVMHWDEGRVAYWILRYHETGQFHYRPIVHGPFLFVVNDWVFALLPPSDFSARLVVAVVGGLLPLSAWLLRDRLRDAEVVALALFLAANPLLVYYSRFMRNDVLVGAFAFVAFALAVRGYDRRDVRYLLPAGAVLGLAFAAKENALLYVLSYAGAGVLLVDHRLLRETRDRGAREVLREWTATARERLRSYAAPHGGGRGLVRSGRRPLAAVAGGVGLFLVVVVFFYAPRPDLWRALGNPAALPDVVGAATVGSWTRFASTWLGGGHQSHDYTPYLYDYLETLAYGAPAVVAFAAVGFVADGYGDDHRGVVAFAAYWGAVSVLGYPLATDIRAPWAAVHAVIPLAVPAAVGVAYVFRGVGQSLDADDVVGAGLAALLLVAAAAGVAAANASYVDSTDSADRQVLQWAQPGNDLKRTLEDVRAVSRHNEGTDVLFVGTCNPGNGCNPGDPSDALFYVRDESSLRQPPPGGPSWHSRLPLPWYLEQYGAEVSSTPPDDPTLPADPPPVIVAYSWNRSDVASQVSGYDVRRHRFRLWGEHIVVFVDEEALAAARA